MHFFYFRKGAYVTLAGLLVLTLVSPSSVYSCACGCNVFDVGTRSMYPTHEGEMVSLEYDYQNQDKNWSGNSSASGDNNSDKKILTQYFTLGYQRMINRKWGFSGDLPVQDRFFTTADEDTGDISENTHAAIGDIRIKGIYSGFSDDMATGLTFGLKLPTGDYTYPNFDPDTQIGTGSTDLLLGAYHLGLIPIVSNTGWFTDAQLDQPVLNAGGYRPGSQVDGTAGVYYDLGMFGKVKIAPMAQVIGSHRWSDSGTLSDSPNTGYSRILLAPGIEFDVAKVSIYGDVGFPVYQYVDGNQLVASELYKINVSYHF